MIPLTFRRGPDGGRGAPLPTKREVGRMLRGAESLGGSSERLYEEQGECRGSHWILSVGGGTFPSANLDIKGNACHPI